MKTLLVVLILTAFGCASTNRAEIDVGRIVGVYANDDGNRVLFLRANGRFDYIRNDDDMRVESNGDVSFGGSGAVSGEWMLLSHKVVRVWPGMFRSRFVDLSISSTSGALAISEPSLLVGHVAKAAPSPAGWLFKAQKPNKAPEPTFRSVTPPAAQESRQP